MTTHRLARAHTFPAGGAGVAYPGMPDRMPQPAPARVPPQQGAYAPATYAPGSPMPPSPEPMPVPVPAVARAPAHAAPPLPSHQQPAARRAESPGSGPSTQRTTTGLPAHGGRASSPPHGFSTSSSPGRGGGGCRSASPPSGQSSGGGARGGAGWRNPDACESGRSGSPPSGRSTGGTGTSGSYGNYGGATPRGGARTLPGHSDYSNAGYRSTGRAMSPGGGGGRSSSLSPRSRGGRSPGSPSLSPRSGGSVSLADVQRMSAAARRGPPTPPPQPGGGGARGGVRGAPPHRAYEQPGSRAVKAALKREAAAWEQRSDRAPPQQQQQRSTGGGGTGGGGSTGPLAARISGPRTQARQPGARAPRARSPQPLPAVFDRLSAGRPSTGRAFSGSAARGAAAAAGAASESLIAIDCSRGGATAAGGRSSAGERTASLPHQQPGGQGSTQRREHPPAWARPGGGGDNVAQQGAGTDGYSTDDAAALLNNRPLTALQQGRQQQQGQQQQARRSVSPPGSGRSPRGSGWSSGGFVSASAGRKKQPSDYSEEYYARYRLKQHHPESPQHVYSQPRSAGPMTSVRTQAFAFDEAHPALAGQHYLRTLEQNRALEEEAWKTQARTPSPSPRRTASASPLRGRAGSPPSASTAALQQRVSQLSKSRDAGTRRLSQLQAESQILQQRTSDVQHRALDAIAASQNATGGSPGRGASPGRAVGTEARMRGRSPGRGVHVSSSASAYAGTAFGAPPPLQQPHQRQRWGPPSVDLTSPWQQVTTGIPGEEPMYGVDTMDGAYYGTDRLLQHQQHQQAAGGASSLADHLAAASRQMAEEDVHDPNVPPITEDEMLVASGAFNPDKYSEYQRQVDMEMERRALEQGGYDSDLEREDDVMQRQQPSAQVPAVDDSMQQSWREQNTWMDFYRGRLGPDEGYEVAHLRGTPDAVPQSTNSSPGPQYLIDYHAPIREYLSNQEEAEIRQGGYAPIVYGNLPLQAMAQHQIGSGPRKRWQPTKPLAPFAFERRQHERPKPISTVKLEQDLELKRQEEEAACRFRFKASPVPEHVHESRYETIVLEEEIGRQIRSERRMLELQGAYSKERPFSFVAKEQERLLQREEMIKSARDPNRFQVEYAACRSRSARATCPAVQWFPTWHTHTQHAEQGRIRCLQVPFRARDVPSAVHGERLKLMQYEMEQRCAETKHRIESARETARRRVAETDAVRRSRADQAYRDRLQQDKLRAIDPVWNQQYDTKPVGTVPDFDRLHRDFDLQRTSARATSRRNLTVPHEFRLNGSTPHEMAAREAKAIERRQRIILDMQLDSELLPESRWPYRMPRGRVRPEVPPLASLPGGQPDVFAGDTRASMLRKAHTRQARRRGEFDLRDVREKKADAAEKKKAHARAAEWTNLQINIARKQDGGGSTGMDLSLLSANGAGTSSGGGGLGGGGRAGAKAGVAPAQYIEARHQQAERQAQAMVEDALLRQGLDANKYIEG
ncbi:hypothetical protein FOA52_016070 [Chlamydomonas sp. UWO 241]|nr:hypothetical protein FOA52_016070 [Chlamydomonas sp. UWO 241]